MSLPPETLHEVRTSWERTLTVVYSRDIDANTMIVVLRNRWGRYHCHRYMKLGVGQGWDVSVDAQDVPAEVVFQWLEHPKALRKANLQE